MFCRIATALICLASIIGCAKAPIKPNTSLCKMAESNARQRLGPEFRKVIKAQLLHDEVNGTYGCGIVYQMMDEELADEFDHDTSAMRVDSHHVAFLSRTFGQPARFLNVKRTRTAKGPVTVTLEVAEVTGDTFLDLIIVERAKRDKSFVDYQGLKVINGNPEATSEIFETSLLKITPDKREVLSEWMVDNAGVRPRLWLRSTGQERSYSFSKTTRRLELDQAPLSATGQTAPPTETTVEEAQPTPTPAKVKKSTATKKKYSPFDADDLGE
ncbi:MAG: hypothetical protein ACPGQS_04250 [Bradymonadia bacterium]